MEKSNAATVAICDTGPLIHLDELKSLELLLADFRVCVPDAVWQEVQRHRPTALQRPRVPFERQPVLGAVAPALLTLSRALSLDAGEIEALSIMAGAPQALFLTDDAAARLAAAEVLARLRAIPQRSSLYIRPALLEEIITRVQQEYGVDPFC